MPRLVRALRKVLLDDGGTLGRELRDLIAEKLIEKGNDGRAAAFHPEVELADLRVQSVAGTSHLVVDVRLNVRGAA